MGAREGSEEARLLPLIWGAARRDHEARRRRRQLRDRLRRVRQGGSEDAQDQLGQARQKQRRGTRISELAGSRTTNPRPPRGSDLGHPASSVEKFLETSVVLYNSKLE